MIWRVLENLYYPNANYILIARNEYLAKTQQVIQELLPNMNVKLIGIDKITEGSVCTILYAHKYVNNDTPLLIANKTRTIIGLPITSMSGFGFINPAFAKREPSPAIGITIFICIAFKMV